MDIAGCNFDRPDFKRLIADIEEKNVNLVVTKDLSRLGRDYIETGHYIEKYFPAKTIRYVAVTDNIDTFDQENSNNDMTPFKSVMNDMYAKDISKKVRAALLTKMASGESIKAFAQYGFKKDPTNKNNIIIDEEVIPIVIKIFELYANGKSKTEISRYLNAKNIETPLQYKMRTTNFKNPMAKKSTGEWTACSINKILRDKDFEGNLVQNKTKKISYKVTKSIELSSDYHIVVEKKENQVIETSLFETVTEMLDKQTNEWNYSENAKSHILKGIAYCSCGARIGYNRNHCKNFRCNCQAHKLPGGKYHPNIHLTELELISKVTEALAKKLKEVLKSEKVKYKVNNKTNKMVNDNTKLIKNKLEKIDGYLKDAFEDKQSGIITQEMFISLSREYAKECETLKSQATALELNQSKSKETKFSTLEIEEVVKEIAKLKNNNEINRSIIVKYIEKVIVDDKDVFIEYKFKQN